MYLGNGRAFAFARFAVGTALDFEPVARAWRFGGLARKDLGDGVLAVRFEFASFFVAEAFAGAFFTRGEGLVTFVVARTGFGDRFGLVLLEALDVFAFARADGLAGFALARIDAVVTFDLARTIGLLGLDLERATELRGLTTFFDFTFVATAPLDFEALRAGAFAIRALFTIKDGRDDLPVNVRLFAEDVAPLRREAGLDEDRFTPLTVGSLMRSSKLSKRSLKIDESPRNLREAYHSS